MDTYCMYLRKSRADIEAEARGEGETLKKHRTALFALAKKMKINITEVYPEILSGERIMERPVAQQLIQEVEDGKWTGVLVMEVERLARGDTMDQGLVAQAFKYSSTKIITPQKIYDPTNEFDEEYFEFGLFMSRREYKTINRRLQGGRIASVLEGNFIGNRAPYGYNRVRLADGSYSLEIDEEKANVVRLIFDMYTNEGLGYKLITQKLTDLNIPTISGAAWAVATVKKMLQCDTYAGMVTWNKRKSKNVRKDGVMTKSRPFTPKSEWIIKDGKHEPIISNEVFQAAQEIISGRTHAAAPGGVIKSPLAGLVRCGVCGRMMVRRSRTKRANGVECYGIGCNNVSVIFSVLEERILMSLQMWVDQSKEEWEKYKTPEESNLDSSIETKRSMIKRYEKSILDLQQQSGNLHDLLERGVYTVDIFLERSQNLSARIAEAEEKLKVTASEMEKDLRRKANRSQHIPMVENVLKMYPLTDDPAEKNKLLKSVLEVAIYKKNKSARWTKDEFELMLYPKIPEI